jgi:hypothetical protein
MRITSSNLKPLKIKRPYTLHEEEYKEDCNRIQHALMEHGYYATISQCAELWQLNSEDMAAGWLFLPKTDKEIYEEVKRYIEN